MTERAGRGRGWIVALLQFLIVLQALLSPAAATRAEAVAAWASGPGIICTQSGGRLPHSRDPSHQHGTFWCDLACQNLGCADSPSPPPAGALEIAQPVHLEAAVPLRPVAPLGEPAHRLTAFPARAPPTSV